MPKLDKLIRELCSDGVKVFRLEEIAHYAKTRIDCKTINEDNYVGVENLLQNKAGKTKATSVPTTGMVIAYQKNDILIGNIRPYLRKVWLADCEGGTNGDVLTVQIEDTEKVIPQFLYYVLSSEKFFLYDIQNSKGAKMPRGSKDAVMKFEVPLPHLDVQREIVRILDNFTELAAELTAELTARKTQYTYYRDELLANNYNSKIKRLEECCDSIADGDHQAPPKADSGIPFITISDIDERHEIDFNVIKYVPDEYYNRLADKRRPQKGDVLYTVVGSYGIPVYVKENKKFVFQRHIAILRPNNAVVDSRYLYHAMNGTAFHRQANLAAKGAAQKTIGLASLAKMTVPVPPLDVQNRIVNVLDNFEKICADLNIGLPAEIEARQKQYEYYRDKLLTFAETGNTILSRAEQSRAEQSRAEQSRAEQSRAEH